MRLFRSLSLIFMLTALSGLSPATANVKDRFFEANKCYSDGDYETAAEKYKEIAENGYKSGNLYYNLGNAYFKLGYEGRAMLNYERAKRLIPQDEDLFANMSFVKTVLDFKQPEEEYSWYERIFISVRDMFGTGLWYIAALVLYLLMIGFAAASLYNASFRKNIYLALSVLALAFLINMFFFISSYRSGEKTELGMIVVPRAEVRYSPSYSGAVAFEVVEGMEADVIRKEGDWVQLRLNRKNSGWVESDAIEKI